MSRPVSGNRHACASGNCERPRQKRKKVKCFCVVFFALPSPRPLPCSCFPSDVFLSCGDAAIDAMFLGSIYRSGFGLGVPKLGIRKWPRNQKNKILLTKSGKYAKAGWTNGIMNVRRNAKYIKIDIFVDFTWILN